MKRVLPPSTDVRFWKGANLGGFLGFALGIFTTWRIGA